MRYSYKCSTKNCSYSDVFQYSINDNLPNSLDCPKCGGDMERDIRADLLSTSTTIPDNCRALKMDNEMNYSKMSRDQKTFY
ncbi:MAG: hypothetical protein PF569_03910 [Candidatus Woesearchaeota archaeon]|jgi:PHP family Zn ribbon phosphoesterase|nr:hypothetical protein [Candidatus Woesearchaeota archaeon]